jgi:hypothetical protein
MFFTFKIGHVMSENTILLAVNLTRAKIDKWLFKNARKVRFKIGIWSKQPWPMAVVVYSNPPEGG